MSKITWGTVSSPINTDDHSARHENGGADEISIEGLSGDPADTINKSFVDAKGDIITASADNTPSILSVGSNGEFLVPNSANANGLEWVSLMTYGDEVVSHNGQVVYN